MLCPYTGLAMEVRAFALWTCALAAELQVLEANPQEVAHSLQRQGLSAPSWSWNYSMHPCKFWGISCSRQGFTM